MISLDQVLMLQKKVETAVEKISFLKGQIEQLKSENDALHTKCAELTKALDEKTELVSSLESNQGKIEEGILSALNRLDTVENSLLDGSAEKAPEEVSSETFSNEAQPEVSFDQQAPLTSDQSESNEQQTEQSEPASQQQEPFRYEIVPDEEESAEENADEGNSSEENSPEASENNTDSLNGQFDIF